MLVRENLVIILTFLCSRSVVYLLCVMVVEVTICFLSVFVQEPKEEEMTEEEKAAQKARPVATNPIPGTPWCVHHTEALFTSRKSF